MRQLIAWAAQRQLETWYGSGKKYGTFWIGPRDAEGGRRALLGCWTSPSIEVETKQLSYFAPFAKLDDRLEVLRA